MDRKYSKAGRVILALVVGLIGLLGVLLLVYRPDRALRVGTASVSQLLCEEVFIAGLDPRRVFIEEVAPKAGLRPLLKRLRYSVDPLQRSVTTRWAGRFASVAHYRAGYGCQVGSAPSPSTGQVPLDASHQDATIQAAAPAVIPAATAALSAALDRAFAEPAKPPLRQVRAIVVMRDGRIIAERYAPGIDSATPLLGYSVSKSVINALVGILVRQGKLSLQAPAPVAAWRDSADPRHAVTLEQLLRMTSGLRLTEDDSGFDPVSQMLFLHNADMAGYAAGAALQSMPGTRWEYSSGNTLIAAAIVRQAVGGGAQDVQRFAREQLFAPLGMSHVSMELDGQGTPVGSTRILASARDWARFGQLYLDDGRIGERQILPMGWVRHSTAPTLGSDYGMGFWVNAGHTEDAAWRIKRGMPADTFYASGNFGQRIVIVPSERLVIVRMGQTIDPPEFDMRGLEQLVSDVIKAR